MTLEWIEEKKEDEPSVLGQYGFFPYPSRGFVPAYPRCPPGMSLACVPSSYSTPIPFFPQRRFRFLFGVDKESRLGATEASVSVGGGLLGLAVLGLAGYGLYKLLT